MIDITQPVTNTLVFSAIALLLFITALGIGAVMLKKRSITRKKSQGAL